MKHNSINNPKHYTQWGIEPIDFIESNKLWFHEANIIKYITRYKYKNGLEDLKKAEVYLRRLINIQERQEFEDTCVNWSDQPKKTEKLEWFLKWVIKDD